MSKIMYKDKPYMSTTDLPEMTLTEVRTGTEEEPRVISPKTLFEFAVNRLTGNIDLDTSAASGDDYDLTQSLTSLGWLSDVVTSGVLGMKKLLNKMLSLLYKDVQGTASVANVGANSGGVVSVPISVPSGFTPFMATVEEYSNQNLLECHVESLTSNSVVVRYANLRSSSATMNFRVKVLCKM